jgi:hypothetical protein
MMNLPQKGVFIWHNNDTRYQSKLGNVLKTECMIAERRWLDDREWRTMDGLIAVDIDHSAVLTAFEEGLFLELQQRVDDNKRRHAAMATLGFGSGSFTSQIDPAKMVNFSNALRTSEELEAMRRQAAMDQQNHLGQLDQRLLRLQNNQTSLSEYQSRAFQNVTNAQQNQPSAAQVLERHRQQEEMMKLLIDSLRPIKPGKIW